VALRLDHPLQSEGHLSYLIRKGGHIRRVRVPEWGSKCLSTEADVQTKPGSVTWRNNQPKRLSKSKRALVTRAVTIANVALLPCAIPQRQRCGRRIDNSGQQGTKDSAVLGSDDLSALGIVALVMVITGMAACRVPMRTVCKASGGCTVSSPASDWTNLDDMP